MCPSGQTRRFRDVRAMSALPQTADISGRGRHFAFVPGAELDEPISALVSDAIVVSPEQRDPSVVCPPRRAPISNSHCTGTSAGAPLFFINNTRNFAGSVVLAFRSTR